MLEGNFIFGKSIFIIINNSKAIFYCNQGIDNGIKIIDELDIMDYINSNSIGNILKDNYLINIEKFEVNRENLYHVVIERCICQDSCLPYSTYMDYHTGLYNRNLWESLNNRMIKMFISESFSTIIIDVDNLKEINDTIGHKFGDYAIRIVAKSIKDVIRKEDIAIRYGGDEFLIILPSKDLEMAKKIVQSIRERIENNNLNKECTIKISAGTSFAESIKFLNDAVEDADYHMYTEKKNKKV